jgi:12-oxophytodienoic acid reductase
MSKYNPQLTVDASPEVTGYFLPKPQAPVGSVKNDKSNEPVPKLFQPLKIKGLELHNRVVVSPMCTYSAAHDGPEIGHPTLFHHIHYGAFALRGVGAIVVEASAVVPEGRLSPEDVGIWNDGQALKWKGIVDFAHSQGTKIGIQLGHGGRKASGVAPHRFLQAGVSSANNGWNDIPGKFVGPSAISFSEQSYPVPHELTIAETKDIVQAFKDAANRAYNIAGFDFVEIHGAHGYLISSFLSGTSNKRTDEYGGSFENRSRILVEIVDAVKDDIHPLFVRISGTESAEHIEGSWTIEDSQKLADLLVEHGVDLLDISSGGNNKDQTRRANTAGHQVPLSKAVKNHVGDKLLVGAVGRINSGKLANEILEEGSADLIFNGREFLKHPGLVWAFADELGVRLNAAVQYEWPYYHPPFLPPSEDL